MNNLKRLSPVLAILGALLLIMSTGCGKKEPGSTTTTSTTPTSSPTSRPESGTTPVDLVKYCQNLPPDECRKGGPCKYDGVTGDCKPAEADVIHDCGSILDKAECATKPVPPHGCRWDKTKTPEVCIKNEAPKTIHVWNKLSYPGGGDVMPEYKKIVMSDDGGHLYALTGPAGSEGLYYRPKGGEWVQLNVNPLSGKPKADATTDAVLDIVPGDITATPMLVRLAKTKDGAMVQKGSVLVILKGDQVTWALDTTLHNSAPAGAAPADTFAQVENLAISFAGVVNTPSGEAVVFQQKPQFKLIFQYTDKDFGSLKTMDLHKASNAKINRYLHAVANDEQGGLLLGTEDPNFVGTVTDDHKWEIYHVERANSDIALANPGQVLGNAPVLFSVKNNLPWPNDAVAMQVVGKMGDYYYANANGTLAGPLPTQFAGLVWNKGPQQTGVLADDLAFVSFKGIEITGTTNFGGFTRLTTAVKGVLGIAADMKADPTKNFKFDAFRGKDKLEEMQTDGATGVKELELTDADGTYLSTILGNDDLAYFVVRNKGIYSRTAATGQPRLK